MAENLHIPQNGNREMRYKALISQVEALVCTEKDLVANLANTAAAIYRTFGFFWVGFYLVKESELVLAPFQGPVACTRIKRGKGVCGTAWAATETVIVPDVDEFPGHIACNAESRSEIVVPLFSGGDVMGVLDIDSEKVNGFDETDRAYLEKICKILEDRVSASG
ncbi:MAG: GAF domain-containing protein [Tannerella sp.]|jgi:GAF domain-containing protein|nr:GAF domain-containing protein [Tannerella sp.]